MNSKMCNLEPVDPPSITILYGDFVTVVSFSAEEDAYADEDWDEDWDVAVDNDIPNERHRIEGIIMCIVFGRYV